MFVSYDVEGGEGAACYLFGLWYEDGVQNGTTGENTGGIIAGYREGGGVEMSSVWI